MLSPHATSWGCIPTPPRVYKASKVSRIAGAGGGTDTGSGHAIPLQATGSPTACFPTPTWTAFRHNHDDRPRRCAGHFSSVPSREPTSYGNRLSLSPLQVSPLWLSKFRPTPHVGRMASLPPLTMTNNDRYGDASLQTDNRRRLKAHPNIVKQLFQWRQRLPSRL